MPQKEVDLLQNSIETSYSHVHGTVTSTRRLGICPGSQWYSPEHVCWTGRVEMERHCSAVVLWPLITWWKCWNFLHHKVQKPHSPGSESLFQSLPFSAVTLLWAALVCVGLWGAQVPTVNPVSVVFTPKDLLQEAWQVCCSAFAFVL